MSLNVKLALLISVGFIAGLCWTVHRVSRPLISDPSPLVGATQPGGKPTAASPATATGANVRRSTLADGGPRLARATPVEAEADLLRRVSSSLIVSAPTGEAAAQASMQPKLPPLMPAGRPESADLVNSDEPLQPLEYNPPAHSRPPAAAPAVATARPPVAPVIDISQPPRDEPLHIQVDPHKVKTEIDAELTKASGTRYVVKPGDSLVKIARREMKRDDAASISRLIDANPSLKKDPNHVIVGKELIIPHADGPVASAGAAQARPAESHAADAGSKKGSGSPKPEAGKRKPADPAKLPAVASGAADDPAADGPMPGPHARTTPVVPESASAGKTATAKGRDAASSAKLADAAKAADSTSGTESMEATGKKPDAAKSTKPGPRLASKADPKAGSAKPKAVGKLTSGTEPAESRTKAPQGGAKAAAAKAKPTTGSRGDRKSESGAAVRGRETPKPKVSAKEAVVPKGDLPASKPKSTNRKSKASIEGRDLVRSNG